MNTCKNYSIALLCFLSISGMCTGQPVINSLNRSGQLAWTYGYDTNTRNIALIEMTTNLSGGWTPVYYDFVSTNLFPPPARGPIYWDMPTNPLRSAQVPMTASPGAFYRVAIQTNIPDPSLVCHLSFNNDFLGGIVLDSSGYGNNGLRYGYTNWPALTVGPDGSPAAVFQIYPTTNSNFYSYIGDYIAVLGSPSLDHLTNATIAIWADYYTAPGGNYVSNHTATLLDASYGGTVGSWSLGRQFSDLTSFTVFTGTNVAATALKFPDATLTGNTGGWHYYVVTFDGTNIVGYFNGRQFGSFSQLGSMTQLRIGGPIANYLAMGTWAHNGTPQWGDDLYPNCCWMNGAMDDLRIYDRALSASEVLALYNSFDKEPPTTPTNLWARADASNQIELRWDASSDNFYVAGYTVRRDGVVVGTSDGLSYVDTGLMPATQYTYTVQAFDGAGNASNESAPTTTNTPASGSAVSVIVDDGDGGSRVSVQGTWSIVTGAGSWGTGFHWGTESRGSQSVTYHPTLPGPGNYGVYAWYGGAPNGAAYYVYATNVPIDIVHSGVTNTVLLNQQAGYGSWAYLGTYAFAANTNEFVRIRTDGTAPASHPSWGAVDADSFMFTQ